LSLVGVSRASIFSPMKSQPLATERPIINPWLRRNGLFMEAMERTPRLLLERACGFQRVCYPSPPAICGGGMGPGVRAVSLSILAMGDMVRPWKTLVARTTP